MLKLIPENHAPANSSKAVAKFESAMQDLVRDLRAGLRRETRIDDESRVLGSVLVTSAHENIEKLETEQGKLLKDIENLRAELEGVRAELAIRDGALQQLRDALSQFSKQA